MSVLITLTTDFGWKDHYVGTMKGVILSRCPTATLVDISHGVTPFSIWEGAYTIAQSASFFPTGTIHVVVIDPGVGTDRKAILAEANGQFFIAPDNGVLSMVFAGGMVREITNRELLLQSVSSTFHGRDVFAAVAGAIGSRVPATEVGPVLDVPVRLSEVAPFENGDGTWTGRVLSVDQFGNVITNIPAGSFNDIGIYTGGALIDRFCKTFAASPSGEMFLYAGSSGYFEIAVNQGNAAKATGFRPGDRIRFSTTSPALSQLTPAF